MVSTFSQVIRKLRRDKKAKAEAPLQEAFASQNSKPSKNSTKKNKKKKKKAVSNA